MSEAPTIRVGRKGHFAVVSEGDYAAMVSFNWHLSGNGYAIRKIRIATGIRRTVLMHRLILDAPEGMDVDHINGDRLDNRRSNLRLATRSQNGMNTMKLRGTKFPCKGVWQNPLGKFQVKIRYGGVRHYLGSFGTLKEAAQAYTSAATQHHGPFARPLPPLSNQ